MKAVEGTFDSLGIGWWQAQEGAACSGGEEQAVHSTKACLTVDLLSGNALSLIELPFGGDELLQMLGV